MASSNSEARKSREMAVRLHRDERRREVMQQALAAVYSGADFTDADALLDQLADRGARVEVR